MTADNIVYGVDFRAKQREPEGYDVERGRENLRSLGANPHDKCPPTIALNYGPFHPFADTSPCETNPTPFVAPGWDGA